MAEIVVTRDLTRPIRGKLYKRGDRIPESEWVQVPRRNREAIESVKRAESAGVHIETGGRGFEVVSGDAASKAAPTVKRGRGRPKGSKNKKPRKRRK